ncbi:zinc-dependent metalloprotease [Bdellovibrio sp. HCB209]|uniref:zinc-dependent metalloprotease n=1 Tax=Bdellovibrio sp. HCB209 TaxID=3394354 RepID=UPI0039B3EBF3
MRIFSRTSVAVLLCTSLLAACTKETVRIEEKLPPAQIQSSAAVNKNTVTFKKSSLGKLFLMMPTLTMSTRASAPSFLKSRIVSFDKSGDRMAVYDRTVSDVQTDVSADVLLQSFQVISENSDEVVFDLGQGFKSIDNKDGLDIFLPSLYPMEHEMAMQKMDRSLKVKDSFVKTLSLQNNSIYISQNLRMTVPFDAKLSDADKKSAAMLGEIPTELDQAANLVIEIKPYQLNESFKPKLQDEQQRFGFFLNKRPAADMYKVAEAQIARWDISDKSGPIQVMIDDNFPEHLKPALTISLQYWNRIFGKELLQLSSTRVQDGAQADRSIVVRWVRWDQGFGAFAGVQFDPMTGESLRGYVYLTTTFTADKKYKEDGQPDEFAEFNAVKALQGFCDVAASPKVMNQVNTLTEVISHELGHVMGLRHNFSGTLNAPASDQEIKESLARFRKGDNSKPVALTSSVMDYFPARQSAIVGDYMKTGIFPYDQMAIDWAYKGVEVQRTANMYCSDEHILTATVAERQILGCARQDTFKNVFVEEREKNLEAAARSVDMALLALKMSKQFIASYGASMMAPGLLNFDPSVGIAAKLYTTEKTQLLLIPDDIVPEYLKSMSMFSGSTPTFSNASNPPGDAKITQDLKDVGGMTKFLASLNPNVSVAPNYFENLVLNYPKLKEEISKIGFSAADTEIIFQGFLAKAKKLDSSEAAESVKKTIDMSKLRNAGWREGALL